MKRIVWMFVALSSACVASQCGAAETSIPIERVLGTWRGFSICTGERAACKDERVRFFFTRATSGPWPVIATGEKLVGASWDTMGVIEMDYDAVRGELYRELVRGTTRGVWRQRLEGDRMVGTLVTLPDSTLGRIMEMSRDTTSGVPVRESDDVFAPLDFLVGGSWHSGSEQQTYAWRNDHVAIHFTGTTKGFFAYDPVAKRLVEWTNHPNRPAERFVVEGADTTGYELRGGSEHRIVRRAGSDSMEVDAVQAGARKRLGSWTRTRP